jgi:cell surface protein SprA
LVRFSTLLVFALSLAPAIAQAQVPIPSPPPPSPPAAAVPADSTPEPLSLNLRTRIETKLERNQNERCTAGQSLVAFTSCRGGFQPIFGVEFNILSSGTLAQRFNVNLDFDSEREFDASNNISLYYKGKPNERLQRLEVGNVSFTPPPSRFITSGIPSGNYGVQAIANIGGARVRLVAAQQKGNVRNAEAFTIGDRTLQTSSTRIEDFRFEARRFFFTVDPAQLGGYPNIDILDTQRMLDLAASLADSIRPTRLSVYRLLIGGQPPNPNGPQFIPRGARNANRGPVYEYLREGVDYYADPSRLWIALLRPLGRNERLVVAYNVQMANGQTVNPRTGGTPDLEFRPDSQFANLLWDSEVTPGDSVFNREIRSAYRIGGDELDRASLDVKIVTGSSGDQEKPITGSAETYLQLFGLAQSSNGSTLDTENRLWPRPTDPNYNIGATGSQKLIRDYFLVFPSLEPFAKRGLASPGNPSNDTLYTTPTEDITSPRRPQPVYHLDTRYASEGVGGSGTFALQSIQLRRNSERVEIDGVPLVRDQDYTVDYDLGRITLNRPDTLYLRPRQLSIWYEENPLFAEKPTNIFALSTEFPMENGELAFTAISQRQSSVFSRPTLGNEAASSLIAGMSGRFAWDASGLTSALQRFMTTTAPSRIALQGELAMSRPDPNSENRAFLESFEGEGGISVPLADPRWYFSSRPIASTSLPDLLTDPARASSLVWQNTGAGADGQLIAFAIREIDPLTKLVGSAFSSAEPVLWLTLLPLNDGGTRDAAGNNAWSIGGTPSGRRWRSLRTVLSPNGIDLTRVEHLEFWALVDTAVATRRANPTLVIDIGDVSENSVTFSPDTLILDRSGATPSVAGYRGKQFQGVDVLDSERDPFTRAFDAAVNDLGLPGDRAATIRVRDASSGITIDSSDVPVCRADRTARRLGDSRVNCTVQNDRLDEEDIDLDNVLNFPRTGERVLRFPVDLSDPDNYSRVGGCIRSTDPRNRSGVPLCWVKVRVPISAPEANTIEKPLLRRMKTLRLTIVSSGDSPDNATIDLPISGLRLSGAPWVKRSDTPIIGIAGDPGANGGGAGTGYVIASLIGTQDSTSTIPYQPPPGVIEQADNRNTGFQPGQIQINERSMRLLAGGLRVYERAEAYYRFPEGQKSFMGYEELQVWARGRGEGWGPDGALQFYIKIGRDADNFYLYRAPVNAGNNQSAWEPEIRVDFQRFFALKAKIQTALLQGTETITSCTAADSALILASIAPPTATSLRYAACDGGYMVYSVDPSVNPPDLASVQEMAVGMVRIAQGTLPVPSILSDTLELWIDDIRLTGVVNEPGYAGHVGIDIRAADFWDVRANVSRRDRSFRQLAEQPTFNTQDALDVISTLQLGKIVPMLGLSVPLTINHRSAGSDPYFMSNSDILADGVPGLRTPRSSATSYSLTMRRSTPLENSRYAPVFNNLSLSTTYASTGARSEYQEAKSSNFTVGLDYNIAATPRAVKLPGWLDRAVAILPDWLLKTQPLAAFRNGEYHYAPTQFRITSALAHATDRRTSFAKPAAAPGDTGRRVNGLNYVWRNGTAIDFRPARALTLRWDISSLRDLRDYGDTSAASRGRQRLLGQDVGLERERSMRSSVSFSPIISSWIRPNISLGSDFTTTQDPNARSLVTTSPTSDDVLPRRMSGTQSFGAGATIDVATGLKTYLGRVPLVEPFSRIFAPADIAYTRSLLSSFDRAGSMAPLSYQFGIGSIDDFRSRNGQLASSAGVTNALTIANTLTLPLGVSIQNRFQRTDTRNWTRCR